MAVELFQDLDALLVADGQILDHCVGVDLETVFLGQFGQELARLGDGGAQKRAIFRPEDHVLDHGEILDQLEMLVDHPDARADRRLTVGDGGELAIDPDLARSAL